MGLCSSTSAAAEATPPPLQPIAVAGGNIEEDSGTTDMLKVQQLAEIFPTWDVDALAGVLSTCHGDINQALGVVRDWSNADAHSGVNGKNGSSFLT